MAGTVIDFRKSTVKNADTLFFLEVPTDLATPSTKAFHMAFLNMEANSIDTGVETETTADVTLNTQSTDVKSYSPTQPFSGNFLSEDPVCKYLQHLFDTRAVGGAAHCYMLEVRKWEKGGNVAKKRDVSISISNITNEAGDTRKIEGTYGWASDDIEGTATIDDSTGIATFTAKGSE